MKKTLALVSALIMCFMLASCGTVTENGTESSVSGGVSSTVIQGDAVPNYPLLRWFGDKDELAEWIADGGKWTGIWDGGWYDPQYDDEYEKNVFYNTCVENGYCPDVVAGNGFEIDWIMVSANRLRSVFCVRSVSKDPAERSINRIYIDILDSEKASLSLKDKIIEYTELGFIFTDYPDSITHYTSDNSFTEKYGEYYILDRIMRETDEDEPELKLVDKTIIFAKGDMLVQAIMYPEVDSVENVLNIFEIGTVALINSAQ